MADADRMQAAVDETNCDREPIHIPGAILPHGAMLVLDGETFEILQAAGDVVGLLGVSLESLLGRSVETLLTPTQIQHLRDLCSSLDLTRPRHLLDPNLRIMADRPLDASVHRSEGSIVLEFEAADKDERFALDPLSGVQEMVRGFDDTTSTRDLCQMAAERVRNVAGYDRVLVYRFMQDGSGWVIAESLENHLEPFLDLHYPAADIPQQARQLYVKNAFRLITQVNYTPAPLTPPNNPRNGRPLDMSHAILRDVSPIHRQYLRNMGVDASMSISIIRGGQLWGLIACHHYGPRPLPRHLRAVCELFGSMFSLALEAREKSDTFGARLASRMVLQNLMLNLAGATDYAAGLTQESPNLLDYIHGGDATLDHTQLGGVAVCVKGRLTSLGTTPSPEQIESLIGWLNSHMEKSQGVYATDRLGEVWQPAQAFANLASGLLVISVSTEPSDYIIWFRPELVQSTNWAGEPVKLNQSGPNGDRLSPRMSFAIWQETVRGRCLPWTSADLDAAFDLRVSLLHVVLRRIDAATRERKRASDRDQLLMAELDHRVKNTIANIQALVVWTSRSADTLTGFVEGLDGRIRAMAKAHSLLSESRWEGVSIAKLMREELDAYGQEPPRMVLSGSDVVLTPKSALALSLAVHELATNAAKYGSLSQADGRLVVSWKLIDGGCVALSWTESNGPLVEQPTHRGFGSTLIERALAMETGGRATLHYLRTGLVCEVFLPASSVLHSDDEKDAEPEGEVPALELAPMVFPQPYRILVVEDSFLLVMALEDVFKTLGWELVGPASRLAEALELARTETFDAALLDVDLDGDRSWDVAVLLKARGLPFVFSTGYNTATVLPAHLAGSAVIRKPYNIDELEQKLRHVMGASVN